MDIRHDILIELDVRETQMLTAILHSATFPEGMHSLALCTQPQSVNILDETDVLAFLERLKEQKLLELQRATIPGNPVDQEEQQQKQEGGQIHSITWAQRWRGAGHIIAVCAELCIREEGVSRAHQYIWHLKEHSPITNGSNDSVFALVRREYWFYRLITGCLERRVAHLLGQRNEGLCLIRALSLCVYLISLSIPACVVIARPKYGSSGGFKLHAWVEVEGKPLNERPNIGHGYRVLYTFPFSS